MLSQKLMLMLASMLTLTTLSGCANPPESKLSAEAAEYQKQEQQRRWERREREEFYPCEVTQDEKDYFEAEAEKWIKDNYDDPHHVQFVKSEFLRCKKWGKNQTWLYIKFRLTNTQDVRTFHEARVKFHFLKLYDAFKVNEK